MLVKALEVQGQHHDRHDGTTPLVTPALSGRRSVLDNMKFGPGNRPYWEMKEGRAQSRYLDPINSHPAKAPHMAPLVLHYKLSLNSHWGWPSRIVCVSTLARQGFKTGCNDFFIFALALIVEIPMWIFMIVVIKTTFTIIDCIGNYYYYINDSESYPMSIY